MNDDEDDDNDDGDDDDDDSFSQPLLYSQETYWCRAAAWLSVQRYRGRAALLGTFMRQSPRALVSMSYEASYGFIHGMI